MFSESSIGSGHAKRVSLSGLKEHPGPRLCPASFCGCGTAPISLSGVTGSCVWGAEVVRVGLLPFSDILNFVLPTVCLRGLQAAVIERYYNA